MEHLRTLIVEDRADDAELMVKELQRGGFEPHWRRVETEQQFLAALEEHRPEVVLCDHSLPGFGTKRAIELLRRSANPVPLIIVSGAIGEEAAVDAMRHGAADYVLKDRLTRVGEAVRNALARHHADERRMRAEAALRDAEARYRTLVEQTPAIVYTWGVSGDPPTFTELYVSPRVTEVLGLEPAEWLADGNLWTDRLHPEDRDRVLAETTQCIEAGTAIVMEYRMMSKDDRVVWIHDEAIVTGRDDAGKVTRYQGVMLDITPRKTAEDQQRRSEEQVRLLDRQRRRLLARIVTIQEEERRRIAADVHDDMIQELVAVSLRIDALHRRRPDLDRDEGYLAIEAGLRRAINRVRHLVFELHPQTLDIEGLVTTLRIHLRQLTEEDEGLEYELRNRLQREPSSRSRATLFRIAREAIANARRHGHAEHVSVSLDPSDDGFLVTVEDDGAGFDADREAEAGHLGLTSMRERAELAGGWFRIESRPGQGTTVWSWLPDDGPPLLDVSPPDDA